MVHIDDDDDDDYVDHDLLEVLEDKVMIKLVEFVVMMEQEVLNLLVAYFHPYHLLIVDVVDDL
jgi:hypothetical protein